MSAEGQQKYGFNFVIGVLNGAFFMFGVAFMAPTTVLPHFISHFTDSRIVVGMSSFLHVGCWCLPQVLAAGWVERFALKKVVYGLASLGRIAFAALGLWGLSQLYQDTPEIGLAVFIVLYASGMVMGGVAGLAFFDMVGGAIPSHRRAAFFSTRFIVGGCLLTSIAGFIVKRMLEKADGFDIDTYLFLFSVGLALMTIGMGVMMFTSEKPSEIGERRSILSGLLQAPALLKSEPRLRGLLVCRLCSLFSRMCWPFFIIFSTEELGLDHSTVGTSMIVQTGGAFIGNVCFGFLASRWGNRFILRANAALEITTALYAGVAAVVLTKTGIEFTQTQIAWIFLPAFFLMGIAWHAGFTGAASYLLDFAPEERRPTYMGILNTTMGLGTMAPVLAGFLSGYIGLIGSFFVAACFGIVAVRSAFRLE